MGKHARPASHRGYLRLVTTPADELEVRRAGVDDLALVADPAATPADRAGPSGKAGAAAPVADNEPEEYGLRVTWQSEAVKIEAAEFLIATRMQQDARLRASSVLAGLRRRPRR
jgi:hypothetical protein